VDILDTKLNRNKFTRHGLHFNISGKEKMANHIGERIINLSKRQKNPTIACKWKEDPKENKEEEGQDGRGRKVFQLTNLLTKGVSTTILENRSAMLSADDSDGKFFNFNNRFITILIIIK
jgi:hypothetical protein